MSALVVADVSRRGTDESAHGVLLLILRHVDARHHTLVVEHIVGQGLCQFRLTHTGGAEEDERGDGALRVLQPGTRAAYGVGDGTDGLVLSDDTLVEFLLQVEQFVLLALHHPAHGDAGPTAHHLGDVVGGHLFPHQSGVVVVAVGLTGNPVDFLLQFLQFAVANLRHLGIVALAFCPFSLEAQLLHLLSRLLHAVYLCLLAFPFGAEVVLLFAQFGNILVELCDLLRVVLALDGLALDFELCPLARDVVEFLGHGVAFHAQFCGSLVHQVDGLVGQETVADIAFREFHGSDAGIVLYAHLVVVLVALFQSAQDGDGRQFVGFVHHHCLETALQRLVLLEIFLVFVERSGSDGPQFTAREGRLQDVGGIHGTLRGTGAHQGVDFVDEEDDASLTLGHLVDHTLESFLELTLVFRTRDELSHVERVELLVLQVFGHVAAHDTLCQSFGDGGLTRSRFTDQDRVVLRAS